MYADFTFYQSTYGGSLIEEGQWTNAAVQAQAVIDRLTFDRLKRGAEADDNVRLAFCAAAEVAQRYRLAKNKRRPGLSGFTNDGYSESYTGTAAELAAQQQAEMETAADLFLPRSHPLRYAGGDGCAGL